MKTGFYVEPKNLPVLVGALPGFMVHAYRSSFVAPLRGERVRE